MPCMRVTVIPFYVKRKGRKVYKFLIKWTEPKFWFGAVRWKVENSDLAHFSEETTKVKKVGLKSFQISNKMNCCSLFIDVKRLKVFIYIVIFVWFPIFLTGITFSTTVFNPNWTKSRNTYNFWFKKDFNLKTYALCRSEYISAPFWPIWRFSSAPCRVVGRSENPGGGKWCGGHNPPPRFW